MYKLLIADDEPIEIAVIDKLINKYYKDVLETVHASNGREAIYYFEQKQCDIAVLDIEMPGINGLEAAEVIRANHKTCSIIFLTAFDEFSFAKRAISVKALEYLLKPTNDEELIAALDEAIRLLDERKTKNEIATDSETTNGLNINPDDEKDIDDIRLSKARKIISEYICKNYMHDISLQDIAATLNYTDAYFCRLFKNCFDTNFIMYLTKFRIEKAKNLLQDITISVKDVGEKIGYQDSNYFSKVFKRTEGITPSEYRNLHL